MTEIVEVLFEHWKLIAFIVSLICLLYVTIKDVKTLKTSQKSLVTKKECDHLHGTLCKKVEEVKEKLQAMDRERDKARENWEAELRRIREFMGRVDQFITDSRNGGFK